MISPFLRRGIGAAIVATLAGCASFSPDGGIDRVSSLTQERIGQSLPAAPMAASTIEPPSQVAALLQQPLTPESAVAVALLNNAGLRASLAELGIAEADLVQAGRLRNPGFSFGRIRGGDDVEIERSIMLDLGGLLTMPIRLDIERRRFAQAQTDAALQAVRLAYDVRRAYYNAVAARQTAQYMEQANEAAAAGAELAQRMAKVGNLSRLDQSREQVFHAETVAQLARARHHAAAAREQLTRLLGLWGAHAAFKLPDRLPDVPALSQDMRDGAQLEQQAMRKRLDVQLAKQSTEATAKALGMTRASGFINVLDAGYQNRSETGKPRANGYEVELALPIFDWGGARVAKAQALYMQSVHRTADVAVRARSEVREAYSAYRTAHDLARHLRDEVVPLRKKISEEVLLRYNGMLASVFELLSDARSQIASVNGAIEAQRDYWMAHTALEAAINGGGSFGAAMLTGAAEAVAPSAEH